EGSDQVQSNLNGLWMIVAAAMVFVMQAGFCLVETGMSRAKNSINIAMKNILDFAFASAGFLFVGFAVMFGSSSGGWLGESFWLSSFGGDSPIWSFWMFQVVFVATAATIASGAMAERTRFVGYIFYTLLLSCFLYPVLGHWVWGSGAGGFEAGFGGKPGWLESLGFHDFAGSTVVHAVGGAAALAGIIVLGPRVGKFAKDGTPRMIPGHNMPLALLGTLLLWFGWYGFNAGSALIADASLGRICANTTIAGAFGSAFAMAFFWALQGRPDVGLALNGALSGLVAITAGCDVVTPAWAAVIGAIGGILSTVGHIAMEKVQLDDVVGAVPVHLFNGVWGTLAVAIFHEELAFFSAEWFGALKIQAIGTFVISGCAFIMAFIFFKIIDSTVGLRATDQEQEMGLDFSEHAANAYADFKTK
ncbi:MAG: ammonium transporter, partial [Verrucomicrobiota bacterium]